jgi:hypothetical protein
MLWLRGIGHYRWRRETCGKKLHYGNAAGEVWIALREIYANFGYNRPEIQSSEAIWAETGVGICFGRSYRVARPAMESSAADGLEIFSERAAFSSGERRAAFC